MKSCMVLCSAYTPYTHQPRTAAGGVIVTEVHYSIFTGVAQLSSPTGARCGTFSAGCSRWISPSPLSCSYWVFSLPTSPGWQKSLPPISSRQLGAWWHYNGRNDTPPTLSNLYARIKDVEIMESMSARLEDRMARHTAIWESWYLRVEPP